LSILHTYFIQENFMQVFSLYATVMNGGQKTGIANPVGHFFFKTGTPPDDIQKKLQEQAQAFATKAKGLFAEIEVTFRLMQSQDYPDDVFVGFLQQDTYKSFDDYLMFTPASQPMFQPAADPSVAVPGSEATEAMPDAVDTETVAEALAEEPLSETAASAEETPVVVEDAAPLEDELTEAPVVTATEEVDTNATESQAV
jgi:hypothetical protein